MVGVKGAIHPPDERLQAGGASCALWWSRVPRIGSARAGAIGEIAARGVDSLKALLRHACARLAERGCEVAVGPMDGTTWGRFRAVIESRGEPPFFLEPDEPPLVAAGFAAAGIDMLAAYRSALEAPIALHRARVDGVARRAEAMGIRIRPLDLANLDAELAKIHALCMTAFRRQFLFTPIGIDDFIVLNRPIAAFVQPELALVAEEGGRLAALLAAVPDAHERARGESPATLVVKTIASLPGRRYAGLAHLLAERVAQNARAMGFRRAIHALMHESNGSAAWSAKAGRPFRRYALFAKPLRIAP
jgi:hypothetical protein